MIHVKISISGKTEILSFPAKEAYIETELNRLGAERGQMYFAAESIQPQELDFLREQLLNLDEINYLAKRMESFDASEMSSFFAIMKQGQFVSVKDLINLTFNLDLYTLVQDISSPEKIGRKHYMTLNGVIVNSAECKEDFTAIGRELMSSGKGILTDFGLLFPIEGRQLNKVYDGQVFPHYSYRGTELLCVEVGYNGVNEYLYLPDEELAIKKAFLRLGNPSKESCAFQVMYCYLDDDELHDIIVNCLGKEDIYAINKLLEIAGTLDSDNEKLWSMIQCGEDKSIEAILTLSQRMQEFEYIRNCNNYEDVGREIINNSCEYELSEELEEFFDFDAFGQYFADENNGQFVNGGFLYGEKSVKEILQDSNGIKMGGI